MRARAMFQRRRPNRASPRTSALLLRRSAAVFAGLLVLGLRPEATRAQYGPGDPEREYPDPVHLRRRNYGCVRGEPCAFVGLVDCSLHPAASGCGATPCHLQLRSTVPIRWRLPSAEARCGADSDGKLGRRQRLLDSLWRDGGRRDPTPSGRGRQGERLRRAVVRPSARPQGGMHNSASLSWCFCAMDEVGRAWRKVDTKMGCGRDCKSVCRGATRGRWSELPRI
mmetsp:Transcript_22058/g.33706  ORF Transcript_22058/g.33706 Transcript_22058/m.33706 type:complete len:225 (+) Transcript_22058:6547-7221(+)